MGHKMQNGDLTDLMLTRKHFPALAGINGLYSEPRSIPKILVLPPYHPSIKEDGINVQLAYSLLKEALMLSREDLEDVQFEIPKLDFKHKIKSIEDCIGAGVKECIKSKKGKFEMSESAIYISPFPLWGDLKIEKNGLYSEKYGLCSDSGYLVMDKESHKRSFKPVLPFSLALMKEYGMTEKNGRIIHQNGWHAFNLNPIRRVLAKNFIIAYNNAVVERKYQ